MTNRITSNKMMIERISPFEILTEVGYPVVKEDDLEFTQEEIKIILFFSSFA